MSIFDKKINKKTRCLNFMQFFLYIFWYFSNFYYIFELRRKFDQLTGRRPSPGKNNRAVIPIFRLTSGPAPTDFADSTGYVNPASQ